jgi:hypothetical protein
MFESKKVLMIGLASVAMACGEICDNNIDDNGDDLIDCADAEKCSVDGACAVAANANTDAVRGAEADVANGNAVFEFTTKNLGVDAAVFVIAISNTEDTCAFVKGDLAVTDGNAVIFIVADGTQADPTLAFTSGTSFVGNGADKLGIGNFQSIQAGALAAFAGGGDTGSFTFDKVGADGFVSGSFQDQVTQDFTVDAEFDTDGNGDGTFDFLTIAPVAMTADFTNANQKCDGLADLLLGP